MGATTKDGATPLYYACKNGFLECARVLLDFGGTCRGTDSGGFTPLWVACARGQYECARSYPNPNPDPDPNPNPNQVVCTLADLYFTLPRPWEPVAPSQG